MKKLQVSFGERSYDILIKKGALSSMADLFGIKNRRTFIITDSGVPKEYAEAVAAGFKDSYICTVDEGESAKSLETYSMVMTKMIDAGITRSDVCVAIGGGVVGDLGGFISATYMRGIDFYNVPTTTLSMVDSSIGGKTAVNHAGIKNIIGAFHQPRGVLIDTDTLKTLDKRQWASGISESIKMALTSDKELFELFESTDEIDIENVILRSLKIKKAVVEADEREGGIRKILNFGHTYGHAVEADAEMKGYYHGECVAIGMVAVSQGEVRDRLIAVLKKYGLPTEYNDKVEALKFISKDKKCKGDMIDIILVPKIGEYEIKSMKVNEFADLIEKGERG